MTDTDKVKEHFRRGERRNVNLSSNINTLHHACRLHKSDLVMRAEGTCYVRRKGEVHVCELKCSDHK